MTIARTADDGTEQHPVRRDTGTSDRQPQHGPVPNGATHAQLTSQLLMMQERAATMPEIEQAKGALMLAYGLTADEAFALLRSYSQNRNVKIRDIAARLTGDLDTGTRSAAAAGDMDRRLNSVTTRSRGTARSQSDVPGGTKVSERSVRK